jgi:antitoxin component of MazEF toxin-antitoxin module
MSCQGKADGQTNRATGLVESKKSRTNKEKENNEHMQLRKVLKFGSVLGITIPKIYSNHLRLEAGEYIEISLGAGRSLKIQAHGDVDTKNFTYGTKSETNK